MKSIFGSKQGAEESNEDARITFRMKERYKSELEALADEKGMTPSTLIRVWVLEKLAEGREKAQQKSA